MKKNNPLLTCNYLAIDELRYNLYRNVRLHFF
ncbi:hypothetical protein FHS80_001525 [Porphyromonas circumdentaria]|nr:hypothetical protein [Porphyromonas circumdentaria]